MKLNPNVIAAVCFSLLVLILWKGTHHGRTLIIRVETLVAHSSMLGKDTLIQAQKRTIGLYTNLPKVVYRCLDDEPKIKYPKHASDNYTAVTMGTNDECGNTRDLDAVLIVHTAIPNFEKREHFRKVYADRNVTWPYKLKVVFLIGRVPNAELQLKVEIENRQYGDTVQGNFLDTYQNLTLKATMGYRWVSETCREGYKLLLKMDDDVILDVHSFFGEFYNSVKQSKKKQRIFCQVWKNAAVNRSGKWKVEKGLFAKTKYGFPYCSGFLVAVTPDIVKAMYETAKSLDFFWIDDIFMYGMVPHALKSVGYTNIGYHIGGIITQKYWAYNRCLKEANDKKRDCALQAIVTSNSKDFFHVFNNFPHQKQKLVATATINQNSTLSQPNNGSIQLKDKNALSADS